jgi:hypothetical protein
MWFSSLFFCVLKGGMATLYMMLQQFLRVFDWLPVSFAWSFEMQRALV